MNCTIWISTFCCGDNLKNVQYHTNLEQNIFFLDHQRDRRRLRRVQEGGSGGPRRGSLQPVAHRQRGRRAVTPLPDEPLFCMPWPETAEISAREPWKSELHIQCIQVS
jgi:hypothetical protein